MHFHVGLCCYQKICSKHFLVAFNIVVNCTGITYNVRHKQNIKCSKLWRYPLKKFMIAVIFRASQSFSRVSYKTSQHLILVISLFQ